MSENSEQTAAAEAGAASSLSHLRILWLMVAVTIVGGLLGFAFITWQFGLGVSLGGALALLNYYWLKTSLRGVFERDIQAERPRFLAGKYFVRYLVFGAVLLIIFLTKTLSVVAVLFGLASFAFAILIEGFIRLITTFIKK